MIFGVFGLLDKNIVVLFLFGVGMLIFWLFGFGLIFKRFGGDVL